MGLISFALIVTLSLGTSPNASVTFEHGMGELNFSDSEMVTFYTQVASGAIPMSESASVTVFTHGMCKENAVEDWFTVDGASPSGLPFALSSTVLFLNAKLEGQNIPNISWLGMIDENTNIQLPASDHICLIYNSGVWDTEDATSNQTLFSTFENALGAFLMAYYDVFHIVPKVNLIGHSRGGLINMMYAINHPYLVSNLLSVGTPYVGSDWAQALAYLKHFYRDESYISPYDEVAGDSFALQYADEWNDIADEYNINTLAIGFSVNRSMITDSFADIVVSMFSPVVAFVEEHLGGIAATLTQAAWCSFANLVVDCITDLLSYETYSLLNGIFNAEAFVLDAMSFFTGNDSLSDLAGLLTYVLNLIKGDLFESAWNNNGKIASDFCVEVSSQMAKDRDGTQVFDLDCTEVSIGSLSDYGEPSRPDNMPWVPHNHEAMNPIVRSAFISQLQEDPLYLHNHTFSLRSISNRHVLDCPCGAVFHDCQGPYVYQQTGQTHHRSYCCSCGFIEEQAHSWSYQHDSSGHTATCSECGYQSSTEAHTYSCHDLDANSHIYRCRCGETYLASHVFVNGKCGPCKRLQGSQGGILPL